MNEQPKLHQLLEMLLFLSSGLRYKIDEIAERFDITTRTVHRYIKTFRDAGFVIVRKSSLKPVQVRLKIYTENILNQNKYS